MNASIQMIQDDLLPPLVIALRTEIDTIQCRKQVVAKDITGYEIRGRFGQLVERVTSSTQCRPGQYVLSDESVFYRPLTLLESDLLPTTTVALPATPDLYDSEIQPGGPQVIQIEVTAFVSAGQIIVTGKDADGAAISETISVPASGSFQTIQQFFSISDDGISLDGSFEARLFIHDGRVQLDWQSGDLATVGRHLLEVILIPNPLAPLQRQTLGSKIEVQVLARRRLPVASVELVVSATPFAGDTLTWSGTGFLDASGAILVSEDGVETVLASLSVSAEDTLTGDVPASTPGGVYSVRVDNPDNEGTEATGLLTILPIISAVSPSTPTAGDTLTISGDGFTGATGAEIEDTSGTVTALTGFVVNTDDEVEGVIPLATVPGLYQLRAVRPTGPSNNWSLTVV